MGVTIEVGWVGWLEEVDFLFWHVCKSLWI